ncbi:class I SAM-dependent methyltransferase [Candidatus Woesearchaeota archaeon]|nr:class I SAM-dependent methyltransferase [Candidatus Woesearchaeota archaeon]
MKFHDFYDLLSAETWAAFFKTPEKISEELKHFEDPRSVLEVGTAEAYIIRQLINQGILSSATGYDISERRLQRAMTRVQKEGLSEKISLCLGDGKKLPFDDGQFDVTLLPQILEHVPTRRGVIDLLVDSRRVADQGLLVSLPLRDSDTFLIRWAKYLDPDHLRGLAQYRNGWIYDPDNVEQLFREIGFNFERSEKNDEFYRLK